MSITLFLKLVYENNQVIKMEGRNKVVCICGSAAFLALTFAVIVCVLFTSQDDPIYKTTVCRVNISVGTCQIQFKLTYRIRATLCYQDTEPIVDIREFLGAALLSF